MIEERREAVEQEIEKLKKYRQLRVDYYLKWNGIMPEGFLQLVQDDIRWAEERITELREQLPPPMSQRQQRAIEEIPEVWSEVTGKKVGDEDLWDRMDKAREEALCKAADKTLQEYADIAAGKDLEAAAKRFEEAREEHGTPTWKVEHHHSASGDKRFEGALEDDIVAHVYGTIETPKLVIEAAPRRTGRTFRSWLCNYFK